MKISMKKVNRALPRLDEIRREYLMPGSVGLIEGQRGHLMAAFCDVDGDGDVSITLYAVGDAMTRNHYYGTNTIDITDIIVDWVKNWYTDRHDTVKRITETMNTEV